MKTYPLILSFLLPSIALASIIKQSPAVEVVQKASQTQIRNLVDPIFQKYCQEECKILGINITVDLAHAEDSAPGFEEVDPSSQNDLAPSAGEIKLLVDEKLGPKSRARVLELINQYLETLDYPVTVNSKVVKFPSPAEAAARVTEMREKVVKDFQGTLQQLIQEYCPKDCLISDFGLETELVNVEEAQFGGTGEFMESGGFAIRVKSINATLLADESISDADRTTFLDLAKLKTSHWKNVNLSARGIRFPRIAGDEATLSAQGRGKLFAGRDLNGLRAEESLNSTKKENQSTENRFNNQTQESHKTNQQNTNSETNNTRFNENRENKTQETTQRIERIERVESGDALTTEFKEMKRYGLLLAALVLGLLIFNAISSMRSKIQIQSDGKSVGHSGGNYTADEPTQAVPSTPVQSETSTQITGSSSARFMKRFEAERLKEELLAIFSETPRVARYVFTKILTEEGIETVSAYISIFGESVVLDMLRDPSLQSDLNELMEYYAHSTVELTEEEVHTLLKRLHHRTVSGKLAVLAARSSHQFDFLAEMDGMQILELVRNESLTVKAIVLTQVDNQKRTAIFNQVDGATKMKIMNELSRIDYLPREYIGNVASALKRKRQENPRLNTEALPGSEVLVNLLERAESTTQQSVLKTLEMNNPDSARVVKNKLVSLDTLSHLPDGQLLEVILSLKHEELVQFLKGVRADVKDAIYSKSPRDLVGDLEEELAGIAPPSREIYNSVERKILNRVKVMAQENIINLSDVNERMLAYVSGQGTVSPLRKVS